MSDFTASDPSIGLRPASQIVPRPLAWLWPGRLPLGKLAILDGDRGVGKSLLTLDLCARLSTDRAFPDGSPGPGPCNSIILDGEDDGAGAARVTAGQAAQVVEYLQRRALDPFVLNGRARSSPTSLKHKPEAQAKDLRWRFRLVSPIRARDIALEITRHEPCRLF